MVAGAKPRVQLRRSEDVSRPGQPAPVNCRERYSILELQIQPDDNTASDAFYTLPTPFNDIIKQAAKEITPEALTASSLQLETIYELSNGNTKNSSFTLCTLCTIGAEPVHHDYGSLFSIILLGKSPEDGRAADALHALISVAGFNVYEQFLVSSMDVAEKVRVVATLDVLVPGSWPPLPAACAGFIAVASLLAAYLTLVMGVTILYARHTGYSRYGNVWHVISQLLASEELDETLNLGNNAGDKAAVEGLRTKQSSKEDVLVKIGQTDGCENIKVR